MTTAGELIPTEPATQAKPVAYLRTHRKMRGRGVIVGVYANGSVRIQPTRRNWRQVVVTPEEINAAIDLTLPPDKPEKPRPIQQEAAPITEPVPYWWPLWKHLHEAHGLTLKDDECNQIARAVDEARRVGRNSVALASSY